MKKFYDRIGPHVKREIAASIAAEETGHYARSFIHLERAHVLGQASTRYHVRIHWLMFWFGWRRGQWPDCLGQLLRLVGAATKTAVGLVPTGNTGGSNISPFKRMPLPPDLQELIGAARDRQ